MTSVLDRPIWNALHSKHEHIAVGDRLARRYGPGISSLAGTADDEPETLGALAALARPDEPMILFHSGEVSMPRGFHAAITIPAVQMTLVRPLEPVADQRIKPLGWADAEDMLALATAARPGPFTLKSQALGRFWGIRDGGRLVAMAGERFRQPGHTEVSGICVHPEWQGRGLGRLLTHFASHQVQDDGDQAYLHAAAANTNAIRLYESLGYRHRIDMTVVAIAPD